MKYIYPVIFTEDKDDGGYVVTCRGLPEAITQGDTIEEALESAADALDEAICGCINHGRDIPEPTAKQPNEHLVSVPVTHCVESGRLHQVSRIRPDQGGDCQIPGSERKRSASYP